jgi:hypothetical protein
LLHDDLVFTAILVPEIGDLFFQVRYECTTVRVYPFVLPTVYPTVYPGVQVHIHAAIVAFIVLQGPACYPFADGPLGYS